MDDIDASDNFFDVNDLSSDFAERSVEYLQDKRATAASDGSVAMLIEHQSDAQSAAFSLPISSDPSGLSSMSASSSVSQTKQNRKAASPLWQYFTASSDDKSVLCTLCCKSYAKSTGISTIKKHFQTQHKNEYDAVMKRISHSTVAYGPREQQKVDNLDTLLLAWIICNQQSFCVAEDERFRALIKGLDERYNPPKRQTISARINQQYESKKVAVKDFLSTLGRKMALTTDTWSACTNQAYLSATLHWIDDSWQMRQILLDLIPLHERHTGRNLAETLMKSIRFFGIGNNIISITTDNAGNMDTLAQTLGTELRSEFNNTEFGHMRCAAHVLNLAVRQGLSNVSEPIAKARKFVSHVRNSQPCFEELKKIFAMKERPFLVPELDVSTRWNSTYLMATRLTAIRSMTDMLIVSFPHLKKIYLQEDDWNHLSVSYS